MVREYPKEYAKDFLKKAEKFLQIAKNNLDKYPEEAAFNAVQATINANDAFTIWVLEKRASKDHREAIILHKEAAMKIGQSKSDIIHKELSARDATGYDVRKIIKKSECILLLKRAERFIDFVENIISKE